MITIKQSGCRSCHISRIRPPRFVLRQRLSRDRALRARGVERSWSANAPLRTIHYNIKMFRQESGHIGLFMGSLPRRLVSISLGHAKWTGPFGSWGEIEDFISCAPSIVLLHFYYYLGNYTDCETVDYRELCRSIPDENDFSSGIFCQIETSHLSIREHHNFQVLVKNVMHSIMYIQPTIWWNYLYS